LELEKEKSTFHIHKSYPSFWTLTFRCTHQGRFRISLLCSDDANDSRAGPGKELLRHGWVGTCCINESNWAEISEDMNFMYRYYQECTDCAAYMDYVEKDNPYEK
jgi:hypothetical protein